MWKDIPFKENEYKNGEVTTTVQWMMMSCKGWWLPFNNNKNSLHSRNDDTIVET